MSTQQTQQDPIFGTYADATITRARATYAERGQQYGDTWRDCPWLKTKAVSRALGADIPDHALRAIAAAVLCDVKHQRNQGGYKDDSLLDEISYIALLAEEMRRSTLKTN